MNGEMCGMMAAVPVDNLLNELSAASVAATDGGHGRCRVRERCGRGRDPGGVEVRRRLVLRPD